MHSFEVYSWVVFEVYLELHNITILIFKNIIIAQKDPVSSS
jgi:hypothetical protein